MYWRLGCFGAGGAFLLGSLLAYWFGSGFPPYGPMFLLRVVRPQDAIAGNFPDPVTLLLSRMLLWLALLAFGLAALSFIPQRQNER